MIRMVLLELFLLFKTHDEAIRRTASAEIKVSSFTNRPPLPIARPLYGKITGIEEKYSKIIIQGIPG